MTPEEYKKWLDEHFAQVPLEFQKELKWPGFMTFHNGEEAFAEHSDDDVVGDGV